MTTSADPRSSQWLGHIATWALTYLVVAGSLKGFLCLLLIVLSGHNGGTVRLFVPHCLIIKLQSKLDARIRTTIELTVYLRTCVGRKFTSGGNVRILSLYCACVELTGSLWRVTQRGVEVRVNLLESCNTPALRCCCPVDNKKYCWLFDKNAFSKW